MGKAYANKKSEADRPEGDFYPTPRSLIWVAKDIIEAEFTKEEPVLEPCAGNGQISQELVKLGFIVSSNDLYRGGFDYLETPCSHKQVITNPPFSLWDEFVEKIKRETDKSLILGRLNYFGTNSRFESGIWKDLKAVYCFDRYVDYRTTERYDGLFHVGAMATAWFLWEKGWKEFPSLHFLSVQEYAKLGGRK